MKLMRKDVIKNISAHFLQQRILRFKMRIERASPDIRFIQYFLHSDVIKMLLFQQSVKRLEDCASCFLLSSVHTLYLRTNQRKCSVTNNPSNLFVAASSASTYVYIKHFVHYQIFCSGDNKLKPQMKHGIFLAVLAAALYALNSPFSKLLLAYLPSTLMAGFLYLGAGLGMIMIALIKKTAGTPETESRLTRQDLPYTLAMILLDIAAPVCLLFGLTMTTAANASLLNNFEIVATAIIALFIFKEEISPRLWLGILFVTASCALHSFEDISSLQFNTGSLFVLLACVCWGIENNCTRRLSSKDPLEIVMVKGIFSGIGSVIIGSLCGEHVLYLWTVPAVLLLGFVAYGLSIFFYVHAQRILGAARTSAYYAVAPFIGVFLSILIFHEIPGALFLAALLLMIIGAWLSS
jgi:drug/metabolite transporter (DMT)-like permease